MNELKYIIMQCIQCITPSSTRTIVTNLQQAWPLQAKDNNNQKHKHRLHLLFVRLYTLIQFDNMAANKPDQVAEIRDCCLVSDVVQHVLVIHWREEGQDQICYRGSQNTHTHTHTDTQTHTHTQTHSVPEWNSLMWFEKTTDHKHKTIKLREKLTQLPS